MGTHVKGFLYHFIDRKEGNSVREERETLMKVK